MRGPLIVFLSLALVACGSDPEVTTTSESAAPTTSTEAEVTTTSPETSTTEAVVTTTTIVGVPDEVVDFLGDVADSLEETDYDDMVEEVAEVLVATGWLFCDRLDEGADPAELLVEYVEELTGGAVEDAPDDALVLAGSVLGSAVGHLCPEHADAVFDALGG